MSPIDSRRDPRAQRQLDRHQPLYSLPGSSTATPLHSRVSTRSDGSEPSGAISSRPVGPGSLHRGSAEHTMLAALLTFSRSPWYPGLRVDGAGLGSDPARRPAVGGGDLWVPGGLLHLGAGLLLFASWIGMTDRPESSGVVTAPGDG